MAKTNWTIDTIHSSIEFKVKHLVISTVTGRFTSFEGGFTNEKEDLSDVQITFSADVNSISTGNDQRDGHLKSDDFFSAEKFPKLTFKSTSFQKVTDSIYSLEGDLTIRDITKTIKLDVEYGGAAKDFDGNTKAGFEIKGKISRKEFGLTWSATTEAGGVVVGDEIRIIGEIQVLQVK